MERLNSENINIFERLQAIIYAVTDGGDEYLYSEQFIELSSKAQSFDKELKLALIAQIKATIKKTPAKT